MERTEKYIVTVETNYGTEVACLLAPHQDVGRLDECQNFIDGYAKDFPSHKYRLYKLEEVEL